MKDFIGQETKIGDFVFYEKEIRAVVAIHNKYIVLLKPYGYLGTYCRLVRKHAKPGTFIKLVTARAPKETSCIALLLSANENEQNLFIKTYQDLYNFWCMITSRLRSEGLTVH